MHVEAEPKQSKTPRINPKIWLFWTNPMTTSTAPIRHIIISQVKIQVFLFSGGSKLDSVLRTL